MSNPRIITSRKATHVLADQTESLADLAARRHPRTTACGRKVDGFTGHHVAGDFTVSCGSCRRTTLYPRLVQEVWLANHAAEVANAEAYVQSRFWPALPREYGALAVLALREVNDCNPDGLLDVSHVNPQPRGTVDGKVTARELVTALRLWHATTDLDED